MNLEEKIKYITTKVSEQTTLTETEVLNLINSIMMVSIAKGVTIDTIQKELTVESVSDVAKVYLSVIQ